MLVYIRAGSLCNSQCPDELILGEPTSNKWHIGVKLAIVVLVVGLSITCIIIKWMFFVWLHHLEKKLKSYLQSFDNKLESSNRVIPQVNKSTIVYLLLAPSSLYELTILILCSLYVHVML